MQNNFSGLDKNKLLNLLKNTAGNDGQKLADAAKDGNINAVLGALSESDRNKINNVLGDKDKLREMLSSKAAADILKNLKNL